MPYNELIMDHFSSPRNVGEIADADGVGEVGNPVCGDMMKFTIKVKDNRLEDVKFLTFGCGAAIAVSSMVSEMAKGKTLDEAMRISNKDVAEALGGLPGNKMHCSNLGADALHKAIEDYRNRQAAAQPVVVESKESCSCAFCDDFDCPIPAESPCQPKAAEPLRCPSCHEPLAKGAAACPYCATA
jgi:nitrogen fixation NifU-like protein